MTTRGIRNNNPGNIRLSSNHWQGLIPGPDASFCTFSQMRFGVRALALILLNYQRLRGLGSMSSIISRWAPPSENDTGAYIASVEKVTGFHPSQYLMLRDRATLWRLTHAIVAHENGGDAALVSCVDLSLGVNLALEA